MKNKDFLPDGDNLKPAIQTQSPRGVLRKGVLKICNKFTGEHPCRSVISIKLLKWVFFLEQQNSCTITTVQRFIFIKVDSSHCLIAY